MKLVEGEDLQKTNVHNGKVPYLGKQTSCRFFHKTKSSAAEQQEYKLHVSSEHLSVVQSASILASSL